MVPAGRECVIRRSGTCHSERSEESRDRKTRSISRSFASLGMTHVHRRRMDAVGSFCHSAKRANTAGTFRNVLKRVAHRKCGSQAPRMLTRHPVGFVLHFWRFPNISERRGTFRNIPMARASGGSREHRDIRLIQKNPRKSAKSAAFVGCASAHHLWREAWCAEAHPTTASRKSICRGRANPSRG